MKPSFCIQQRNELRAAIALVALVASPLAGAFTSGSTGADGALAPSSNVEIVLPPSGVLNYTTITIPSGVTVTFKRNAQNTPVQLLASGNVSIAGTVDVRGGNGVDVGTAGGGTQQDEGKAGTPGPGGFAGGPGGKPRTYPDSTRWNGSPGFGPGGGWGGISLTTPEYTSSTCYNSRRSYEAISGMGAGYSVVGATGNCGPTFPGIAQAYGSAAIQPLIGGSGGGGGAGGTGFGGAGGGGGGGAILIASSGTLSVTGTINADGGYGGAAAAPDGNLGYGGAASGGAIRLVATSLSGSGSLFARATCHPTQGCPSLTSASTGRIRLEADTNTFSGQNSPTASRDVPGPVSYASFPTIRIATIAGQAVPATPTGTRDVTLPSVSNPVTVDFATTNIPPGNTIKLRIVPSNGDPVEALSPAITGTTANGTASVSANLPNGASSLMAMVSFTVAVAMGENLSRYAANERVERIELVTSATGATETYLVTVSGKRHSVSPLLLQALGAWG